MSGHSKWATIKRAKGAADAKRGQIFTKLIKEITAAAKTGGGNPEGNPRLRVAISKAKEANMPKDNIEKAVKRGTGELPGVIYEEVMYEGYAPGGVAVLVEALTDNKNRTTAEIRNIFTKQGGNMAGAGSVAWIFHKKGYILVDKTVVGEEKLMDLVITAGAEDMKVEETAYEITTSVKDFEAVKQALSTAAIPWKSADLTMLPSSTVPVKDQETAKKVLAFVEALEDHDDVNHAYANFDIPDSLLAAVAAG
ncbi:MAG: YebC/PmpR family DNA-binding transcriptional regulator [Candidatus Omnitrophica bacterium]|nr:YebC/PmpR family DNA-binding transcriptional regulator [Candidatus Omnitrophota bacterium]